MSQANLLVQTTLRVKPQTLYEAKYYLSLEGISVVKFLTHKLEEFVETYRKEHPERAPRGSLPLLP
jgi:hypothetical protein